MGIKALFVDIGGVVLTNGWDRHARKLAAQTFQIDEYQMTVRHELAVDDYEKGLLTMDQYLDRVIFFDPRPFSHEQFKEFIFSQSKPYPDMIDLLSAYKTKYGFKVLALSNEGRELAIYRIQHFRLERCFDFFLVSGFIHYRKPEREFYQMALDVSQASPEEVIYIEDRLPLVEAALALDIHGIPHTNCESTRALLETRLQNVLARRS